MPTGQEGPEPAATERRVLAVCRPVCRPRRASTSATPCGVYRPQSVTGAAMAGRPAVRAYSVGCLSILRSPEVGRLVTNPARLANGRRFDRDRDLDVNAVAGGKGCYRHLFDRLRATVAEGLVTRTTYLRACRPPVSSKMGDMKRRAARVNISAPLPKQ